jgi:hypothetical protein
MPPAQLAPIVFQRVIRADAGQVSLDSLTLSFFVEVDGEKTAAEIGGICGFTQTQLKQVVEQLLTLKLIETKPAAANVVDEQFMTLLQQHLSRAIGPIAAVIIEDAVTDLGCSIDSVPARQAPELVELLAREIQREEQRIDFKQNMVKIIMEKGYSA